MIYLRRERKEFEAVQKEFRIAMKQILLQMETTFRDRGEQVDQNTPIHHRQCPEGMLHEIIQKARRLDSVLSIPLWYQHQASLLKVQEECVDVANYAVMLAAMALLFLNEEK